MGATLFTSDQGQSFGGFVRVALERSIDAPEGLTYGVPRGMESPEVGSRVVVPLGRRSKPAAGIVVAHGRGDLAQEIEVKPILSAEPGGLGPRLLELARWISSYYACPLGIVTAAMSPAGAKRPKKQKTERLLAPTGAHPAAALSPAAQAAWEKLAELPGDAFPIAPKPLAHLLDTKTLRQVNEFVRLGLLRIEEKPVRRAPVAHHNSPADPIAPPELTAEQRDAIEAVENKWGVFASFVLFGVTGSGKTEVFLKLVERAVEQGRDAIVLVPEISLTPQTVSRFAARLSAAVGPDRLAVLHSGLTPAQRRDEWTRARAGEARVVIGARSAVFAPVGDSDRPLGLIIVDEEHDSSYKQESQPRYHARDVAIKRAQLAGCPVVLASATPSLESWHNAHAGRASLLTLRARVAGTLPRVELIDLKAERRADAADDPRRLRALGPILREALAETIDRGEQAIILLNRRGYASHIACPSPQCGWVMTCAHCDVASVLHKLSPTHRAVRCHHCLAENLLPAVCPVCGKRLTLFNHGTQRLEEELAETIPGIDGRLLRMDADSMRTARDYFASLERFRKGEISVLMGTQMLAKGLDFPGVTLVGVVQADAAISLPDFRATERTFQLVTQVAGRAGRSSAAHHARVLVQALTPELPALLCAQRHDYTTFANQELADRQRFGLPPATRLARLVFRDEKERAAWDRAREIAGAIRTLDDPAISLSGPMACAIPRIADRHRVELRIAAASAGPVQRALASLRGLHALKDDASCAVDVDPVSLM